MTSLDKHYLYTMYSAFMELLQSDFNKEISMVLDRHNISLAQIYNYIQSDGKNNIK